MGHTAFLFPGQGSQYVGMGQDLFEGHAAARRLIEEADAVLGFPLSERMFGSGDSDADAEALKQTDVTQPALFVHSLAVLAALREEADVSFDMVAGHSLGEYTALAASGALGFADGLRLVRERGRLMAEAGTLQPGAMAAIIGMEDADVEAACAAVETGIVQPANYNSPGQIVISGDQAAVDAAMAIASERGARRVIPLPVSGAFHSPLMEHARAGLADALESVDLVRPSCPVYLNVTAAPETDPAAIRSRLLEQLLSPVKWSQILAAMAADGADQFVEVGAGKVLSGLVKRTLGRDAETLAIGTTQDISSYTSDE